MPWLNVFNLTPPKSVSIYLDADGKPYQAILKGCQSVIVIANGGSQMWNHFITISKKPHY